uniref:AlNc14C420G11514 protein n=1 Tax=Albugo laibachii Nc14 TaxID=890382 RepID=F0WZB1_9STRA|nr:AlNc14C420G11514 [Albugo laibachii Nc14]|eukprot:CCA26829.1 AlNc14C420G11514 [Albugo laibachii Nc14]
MNGRFIGRKRCDLNTKASRRNAMSALCVHANERSGIRSEFEGAAFWSRNSILLRNFADATDRLRSRDTAEMLRIFIKSRLGQANSTGIKLPWSPTKILLVLLLSDNKVETGSQRGTNWLSQNDSRIHHCTCAASREHTA